ncbi:MAG: hypothetical protein A4E53_04349 [Pelotomaculum sp. PtaB.Bin104]|nr:MAG: hypothetical protein A4E53_04349 [Pelotomaculum sp. PtaB.Bin104]
MRLAELYVDGFGILCGLRLGRADLRQGFTVIYGMNEAGKSTLMAFIQAVLFGFKVKNGYGSEPLRGGRLGGYLVFTGEAGEEFRVERRGRKGKVVVRMPDGTTGDETFLQERILKNITPLVFRNVFALGMDDLRRVEDLRASEVSAHVYGAGTGLRAGSLSAGLSRLQGEMNELFRPGGSKPAINQLLKGLQEIEVAVRGLQQEPEQYRQLKKEVVFLRGEREKLEAEKNEAELAMHRLQTVIRARESWVCLQEARQRLIELPVIETFPESGTERLQALEEQVRELTLTRSETDKQIEALRSRLGQFKINSLLLEHASNIKSLAGERVLQLERLRQLPELAMEVKHAEAEYQEQERKLEGASDSKQLEAIDTSLPARERADGFRERFIAAEDGLKNAQEEVARFEFRIGEKEIDLAAAGSALAAHRVPAPPRQGPLAVREKALDVLDTGLRRIAMLRNNLAQLRTRLTDLEQQKEDAQRELGAKTPRYLSGRFLLVLAVLLVVLIVAVFTAGKTAGFLALAAGAAVLVLVGQAARRAVESEAARASRLAESLKKIQQRAADTAVDIEKIASQEKTLAKELAEAAWLALGRPEVLEEEIPDARRALEEEKRKLVRTAELRHTCRQLTSVVEGEKKKLSAARSALGEAERRQASLVQEWQNWLKEQGLPGSLTPSLTITFYDTVEEAVRRYQAWVKNMVLEKEARLQAGAFLERLNLLLAKTGQGVATLETSCDQVDRLEDILAEANQLAGEKIRLQEQIESLVVESRRLEANLRDLTAEINALLTGGGAADPAEFHRRASVYRERMKLTGEIQTYERDLKVVAGSPGELVLLEQSLQQSERAENEMELIRITNRIGELQRKINESGEKIGRLDSRINLLENGEDLAVRLQEKEMLLSALQSRVGEWQVRALCLRLLNLAKERHERERQPAVLQRASAYIRKITGGAYIRVMAPAGRTEMLEVESSGGVRVPLPGLSRGTASQLYLSVRLALAHQYSGVGLPVILDDILVDFDLDRLRGAVRVLGDFSRRRQVLLFTCHEHVMEAITECLDDFGLVRLAASSVCKQPHDFVPQPDYLSKDFR